MTGHDEHWGSAPVSRVITTVLCNRCAKPYTVPGGPLKVAPGDTVLVLFPCCPDGSAQAIEWDDEMAHA